MRNAALWGLSVLLGLILAACATNPPGEPAGAGTEPTLETEAAPSEREEKEQDRDEPGLAEPRPDILNREELTVAFSQGEMELDFRKSYRASEAQILTALYEGLFSYHPLTMEPVPALASKWEISNDKKEWTFTIREHARYWNGDPVRAEDFRAAWLSLLNPERESPYSSLFDIIAGAREYRLGIEGDPANVGITVSGERTLVVRLNSPASFFPSMLCHHSFSPIHPSMVEASDWSAMPPISNGPFYIMENTNENMVLVKNEFYWDVSRVALKKITIRYTEDGEKAAYLWNSGEVDLDRLTDRSGILVNAMFATHYYFIRSGREPWNDYRLRRALSLALPWDQIREGYFLPARTLIYPISGYPEITGIGETDVEEARRLLAEAGYPKGVGLPELIIRLTPAAEAARVGGIMAAVWMEQLGVPVKIDVVPHERYFQSLKQNDYEVGSSTWIGDFADPYTFLQMWRRDSNLNDARYNDTDYEDLMEKSMGEEGEERWTTLSEAETMLLDRGTVLPISFSPAVNVVDMDELDGWFPNALDIHPFKYLAFKSLRPLPGIALGR
jgi:peptide/nickel transport system substrate-binding protein/oligopeptide transport system substrate-binding protein